MKTWKSYLIILLFTFFSQQGISQCNDSGIKGPPDERVMDRLKAGDLYGAKESALHNFI